MAWIQTIDYSDADNLLKREYDKVKGPNNYIDNILKVHSLRPHTLKGHMQLYKNVLHHIRNTVPKWYLETIGVYVSKLNRCEYCVEHHFAGLARLVNRKKANDILMAIDGDDFEDIFDHRFALGMRYAKCLTLNGADVNEKWITELRESGMQDGEILEINQVISYFNYANRTVLGLGVSLTGDVLGLSPNDSSDPDNWQHT